MHDHATTATTTLRLKNNQRGATAIEYAMLAAILGIGLLVAVESFGSAAAGLYTYINTRYGDAVK